MCYLPVPSCYYFDNTTDCPSICDAKGGTWDYTASLNNPYSPHLCNFGKSVSLCMDGCESSEIDEWYTGRKLAFYGSCEQYDMCVLDLNKTLCTAYASATSGWIEHSGAGYPKWMSYDWATMSLVEGHGEEGRCVLSYSNVNTWLDDNGGDQIYVSSGDKCAAVSLRVNGAKHVTNVSGKWRPARSLRPGFMDSKSSCENICQQQLWV
jgi:hypothetical protein